MGDKADVWQGTLVLMVLKTLEALGPLHLPRASLVQTGLRPPSTSFRRDVEKILR